MRESRIANVAGALWLEPGGEVLPTGALVRERSRVTLERLAALFDETLRVGGAAKLSAPGRAVDLAAGARDAMQWLVGTLSAARAPRVLIVAGDGDPPPNDLLLALTAWPEGDVVRVSESEEMPARCAIYRREVCLAAALAQPEGEVASFQRFLSALDVATCSLERLGLGDLHRVAPAIRQEAR